MSSVTQVEVKVGYLCPPCQSIFVVPAKAGERTTSCEIVSSLQTLKDRARDGCAICLRLLKRCERSDLERIEPLRFQYHLLRRRPDPWLRIQLPDQDQNFYEQVFLQQIEDDCKSWFPLVNYIYWLHHNSHRPATNCDRHIHRIRRISALRSVSNE
jgi:hypothetical protein